MSKKRQKFEQRKGQAMWQGQQQQSQWHKRGLREPSIEIKTEWPTIVEISRPHIDKLPGLTPALIKTAAWAGEIHAYNQTYDKARCSKPIASK